MRDKVPPKAQTPFPFTPSQPGLARRSFTVKPVPEIATSQTPPDLQTQLERAERFGHNFGNIPLFAPGTQPPLPPVIQSQLTIRQLRVPDEQSAAPSSSLPTIPLSAESHEGSSEREIQPSEESKSPLADYMRRVAQAGPQEQSIQRKFLWQISAQSAENHQGSSRVESQPSHTGEIASGKAISPVSIQTKLTVGAPGDKYEQEADRVAARVMRMSAPPVTPTVPPQADEEEQAQIQTKPLAATITPLVQRQEELGNEETVQAKCEVCEQEEQVQRSSSGVVQAQPDLETQLNSTRGGGNALPNDVRSFMEPRFGANFSDVRVHTGSEAVQMNRELGAQAFAHGSDIYFGAGKSPGNNELTAHELTHVVQQRGGVQHNFTSNEPIIQHKIGDGHDLTAARFSGDPVLEACYDNEQRLKVGSSGSAVEKLQQALVDAGFPLPKYGVDGKFGSETKTAVVELQKSVGFSGKDLDGIVGPNTMGALDARYASTPPAPTPPGPTPPGPAPSGLSYEEAKKKIQKASEGWGTNEDAIYGAIRDCYERDKLKNDAEVQALLKDEMSGHDLWKAQLLLEFGSEAAFPEPIKEIWSSTDGWGTDEERIYKALQKLSEVEIARIRSVPGLREILDDELSGKDLKAANDLLSGDYAKQIAKHKENVARVKQELTDMKKPSEPTLDQNTAEWLDPSTPGAKPKNELYVLTPTHDSADRAKEHGHKDERAYFGDAPQFPDDSATYEAHISSERNIHYSAPSVAGEHLNKKIWLHDPKTRTSADLRGFMSHEVQHDADRHDTEEGHDKAFKSPEESWNRYKTEFRAYWIAQFASQSTTSGTATNAKFDNAKQEAIFLHLYGSSADDVYAVWLRPNYDKNTKLNGKNFQDLVHCYTKPEGVNLANSPRIDNFFLQLQACGPSHTDLTKTPLKELDSATNVLDANDRAYINSSKATRLQDMMKKNLEKSVLKHIATTINNGTEPAWAKYCSD